MVEVMYAGVLSGRMGRYSIPAGHIYVKKDVYTWTTDAISFREGEHLK